MAGAFLRRLIVAAAADGFILFPQTQERYRSYSSRYQHATGDGDYYD